MTVDQVVAALWRRKSLVAAVVLSVLAIGLALVVALPNTYKSTVVVRVEPQRPDETLVKPTVSELIENRLLSVRQELLGRPVLQKVIEQYNLYPAIVQKTGMDAAVERMRADLDVKLDGDHAFEITYSAGDPATAAKVANRIPEIYAEQTVQLREEQAKHATQLFADEMNQLKQQVNDWENKITQFKVAHEGELPEQLEVNMRGLERIGALLQTKSEELRLWDNRRTDLTLAHDAADTAAGRLKAAEDALTQQLVDAKTMYTADHPEVQQLTSQLAAMRVQRKAAEAQEVARREERARAIKMENEVEKEIDDLHQQAKTYQQRLADTPKWGQELSDLNRNYEMVRAKYESVVSREVEAEIAQELEAKNAKTMFNVVSPAEISAAPAKPDRATLSLMVLLLALVSGVVCAIVMEMRDDSLRDVEEVKGRLPLPVLAVVPMIQNKGEKRVLTPATGRNTAQGFQPPLN